MLLTKVSVDKLHWTIDSLVLRTGVYFGSGWVFHEEKEIQEVLLVVRFENGESQTTAAEFGKLRQDVIECYPQFSTALHSGYLFFGSSKHSSCQIGDFHLQGKFFDGKSFDIKIPKTCVICHDEGNIASKRAVVRQLILLVKRSWYLLANGQFLGLFEKAGRYLRNRPKSLLTHTETVLQKLNLNELRSSVLIIDHDLGGGANQYRERLVAQKISQDVTVLVFSFHVATLSYVLMIRSKRLNERFAITGYDLLIQLANRIELKEIIYNTGVSFTRPDELPQLIIKLKTLFNPRLTLLVHDFFMVCPSHFLLDNNGVFCNIPQIDKCRTCLPKNQQGFATLFRSQDMIQWRTLWGNAIKLADEVQTFSLDTLKLLQKAYPTLDLTRAIIKPHNMEHLHFEKVLPIFSATLKIGVVGQIGVHKGAKFIQGLAQEIKIRKLDIQIVIIGTIEVSSLKSIVRQTGPYQHAQLPEIIKSSEVNVMLFPSIWPETFSYVVQELMALDLPVACFNMGAPAEKLSNYAKGLVLPRADISSVLDELILFHRRIYLTN